VFVTAFDSQDSFEIPENRQQLSVLWAWTLRRCGLSMRDVRIQSSWRQAATQRVPHRVTMWSLGYPIWLVLSHRSPRWL